MKIWKEFSFEAAHQLPPHPVHGHSYRARVTIDGEQQHDGWVWHMDEFARQIECVRANLDHRNLNEILQEPTLENLCWYIGHELKLPRPDLDLVRVEVWRPTCGDGAIWERD